MIRSVLLISLLALMVFPAFAQETTTECETGFKLIEHALGETCIPEKPERVAAIDMAVVELLLIAEMEPVVVADLVFQTYAEMHPELGEIYAALLENAADMGFPPNPEVILEAEPDLIIGFQDMFMEGIYTELNEVAPTILYEPTPGDWRERLIFAGEVLGLSDLVDTLLADYDARVAELQAQLLELDPIEVSLVRTLPGQIGLVLPGTTAAALLEEAGLARPEAQAVDYDYVLSELNGRPELLISEEELQLADGDIIFLFGDTTEILASPLWATLSAVENEQAYEVGYYWWGDTLLSAHDMIDDLFEYVLQTESTIPNPFENGFSASTE